MPMRIARRFAVVLCAALIVAAPSAAHARSVRPPTVIVGVSDAAHMASVRAALELRGGVIREVYRWNAFLVSAPLGTDSALYSTSVRGVGGVRYAQVNSQVHAYGTANDPLFSQQWGLPDIGAPTAWDSVEGSGVAVAEIDSGIDSTHPDLAGNVVLYKNYIDPLLPPTDGYGHGTHVAGIIAAMRNNAIDGAGTAPRAKVYAFKVLDENGDGDDVTVAVAIRDAADSPCKIISMSLGGPTESPAMADAVSYARSRGALVIAATGNSGSSAPSYPAAIPGVIGVGAVDRYNERWPYSSYGSLNCDIVAPGVDVLSTWWPGGGTQTLTGTSMAAPFVSGSAALVWARNPSLDATAVANLLQGTAQDLGTPGVDQFYGHGLVRVDLAVAETPSWDTTPPVTTSDAASSYVGAATIHLTATDNAGGSGVAHTYYRLDGGAQLEGTVLSATAVGAHTLEFWSVDGVGNVETPHKTAAFSITPSTFTISSSAGAGGVIAPSGAQVVASGAGSPLFAITPSSGYHIADVLVDGVPVGTVSSFQFTNVTANHTIAATFAINSYAITASAGSGGSISPSGVQTVDHGSSIAFAITPSGGYHIADVLVDGASVGDVASYTFTGVTAAHTIAASFAPDTPGSFTISPSAGAGGSISPAVVQTVASGGSSPAFTITPSGGYHIADVLVDGSSVGAVGSYTFTGVVANHTIAASFAADATGPIPTTITIKTAATATYIGRTVRLSGLVTPQTMIGRNIVVYVMKAGKTYWTYSSNRTAYTYAGSPASWVYPYYFKPGMARGYYKFKARAPAPGFPSSAGYATSESSIIIIRVR